MRCLQTTALSLTVLWTLAAHCAPQSEIPAAKAIGPRKACAMKRGLDFALSRWPDPPKAHRWSSPQNRAGQHGWWRKSVPVEGGKHYRFQALRKAVQVANPRRSIVAKIIWQDDDGKLVPGDDDLARPEYPADGETDANGWTQIAGEYQAPPLATQAALELHLRWSPGGVVRFGQVTFREIEAPASRKVRLAAVHFRPHGEKTPEGNLRLFAPLIEQAAKQRADLVCLGECVTLCGTGLTHADVAEPIPGPSTEFLGKLAKRHNLYIVAGLMEREGQAIYNAAVLLGPDGKVQGKYRKVCLPREEIEAGVTPGDAYPVFETRFGKLGLMICWDVHFPEVARGLSNHGAEVIALPIWGGNPALAAARAIENQVFLVSSTYSNRDDWMKSGVWDHQGKLLCQAKKFGTVVVSEVDLAKRTKWKWLGDFKSRIYRERPAGFQD